MKAQYTERRDALSAAAFPNERNRLTGIEAERDIVDGDYALASRLERRYQVLNFDETLSHGHRDVTTRCDSCWNGDAQEMWARVGSGVGSVSMLTREASR